MGAENSRFFPNSFSKKETRRVFLGRGVKIAEGGASIYFVAKVFGFPAISPEQPTFERIDQITFDELSKYEGFETVAHNGGNLRPFYRQFKRTGCNFIETDAYTYRGKVYVGHEEYFAGVGLDRSQGSITLSRPSRKLSTVIQEIKKDGYKVLIDFKDTDSPGPVLDILEENQISDAVFSGEAWSALGQVREKQGGDASNLFYTIQNERNIDTFFVHDGFPDGPFGISLDAEVASEENISRFHEAGGTVFVYVVKTARQALRVLGNGADGLITNNLTLLSLQARTA
ncbi:MAG: hypothetical protein HYT08_04590 [Candidatus Levybacteria bacterium]|nr:hypothetical protein [Candidatus Levybacteria bacterium]